MTETAVAPVTAGELAAFGLAMDEARAARAAALRRAETAEAELHALAGRIGDVIRAAAEAERKRLREPVEGFLARYGDSEILMFRVAVDLASSIRKLLADPDGKVPVPEGAGEEYLTPAEATAELGVSSSTAYKWAASGRLETVLTPGGTRRYLAAGVRALREERDGLVSTEEVAGMFTVSPRTVGRWAEEGKLRPARDHGKRGRQFRAAEVAALFAAEAAQGRDG